MTPNALLMIILLYNLRNIKIHFIVHTIFINIVQLYILFDKKNRYITMFYAI